MNQTDLKQISKLLDRRFADFEKKMDEKLERMTTRINANIGEFMDTDLFPVLYQKADKQSLRDISLKSDLERLEKKVDQIINNHEVRIRRLESVKRPSN